MADARRLFAACQWGGNLDEIRKIVAEDDPDPSVLKQAIDMLHEGASSAAEVIAARDAAQWLEGQIAGRRLLAKIRRTK